MEKDFIHIAYYHGTKAATKMVPPTSDLTVRSVRPHLSLSLRQHRSCAVRWSGQTWSVSSSTDVTRKGSQLRSTTVSELINSLEHFATVQKNLVNDSSTTPIELNEAVTGLTSDVTRLRRSWSLLLL